MYICLYVLNAMRPYNVQVKRGPCMYRDRLKGWYVVARNFFLLITVLPGPASAHLLAGLCTYVH